MKTAILVNGKSTDCLPASDRGLQYGDGLFETIAVLHQTPQLWERHVERLTEGCARLSIPLPDVLLLREEVAQVIGGEDRCVVKLIVTRGLSGRGYRCESPVPTRIVLRRHWPGYPDAAARLGVTVRWCRTRLALQPQLAGLKHLNRLEQVLARSEWQDEAAEGLMCDSAGRVIEGTMSNLFLVVAGTLVTPDLSQSGVAGVMRAEVLARAAGLGIATTIKPVTPAMVEAADELFLTNSLIGLWPVARLDTRPYAVGKITQTFQAALPLAG